MKIIIYLEHIWDDKTWKTSVQQRRKKNGGTWKTSSYTCACAERGESTQEMEVKILKQVALNGGVRFFLKKE